MEQVTVARLARLHQKMRCLLEQVQASSHPTVKRTVCELYYLQKLRELELIGDHLEKAEQMLGTEYICLFYKKAYHHWRKDVCWIHRFLRKRPIL